MNQTQRGPSVPPWDHWNTERLLEKKAADARMFARGFHLQAFSDDERMFPSFKDCYSHGVALGNIARGGWPVFMGVDLAGPKRPGNVIFAAALEPNTQRRYPLEIQHGAWTSPETAKKIFEMHSRYSNVRYIMVENNGYQQAIIDWVRHSPRDYSFWYKIESFTTGANKMKPEIGLPSLEIEFKNKAWVIPADEFEGHPFTCQCGWCYWTGEMKDYPMSATTDSVMAMWFCREAIARWGGGTGQKLNVGSDFNAR